MPAGGAGGFRTGWWHWMCLRDQYHYFPIMDTTRLLTICRLLPLFLLGSFCPLVAQTLPRATCYAMAAQ